MIEYARTHVNYKHLWTNEANDINYDIYKKKSKKRML